MRSMTSVPRLWGNGELDGGFVFEADEEIAGTFAGGAFFIVEVAGGFTLKAFGPVGGFGGDGVGAVAALKGDGFTATRVGDPGVVTNSAAVCTTSNRQVPLHVVIIRRCLAFTYSLWSSCESVVVRRLAKGLEERRAEELHIVAGHYLFHFLLRGGGSGSDHGAAHFFKKFFEAAGQADQN
jgi:hypothetical protein